MALAKELEVLGIDLVVLDQAIDTTTAAGRLLFHMLAAIAEFGRDLTRDRVLAGLKRARAHGRRGGRPRARFDLARAQRLLAESRSVRAVAKMLGVSRMTLARAGTQTPVAGAPQVRARQGG